MQSIYIRIITAVVIIVIDICVYFMDSVANFIDESVDGYAVKLSFYLVWAAGIGVVLQGLWRILSISTRGKDYQKLCELYPGLNYSLDATKFAKPIRKKI